MSPKLLVIVGVTGNQGGSVAARFLQPDLASKYRIRGLTRNVNAPKAKELAERGVEMVQADLNDTSTLIPAFKGAQLIFSVTNYWEPFFHPAERQKADEKGVIYGRHAYDVENQQSLNIADAAATTVDTLDDNGFIVSTLSNAKKCSNGKFTELYHFDGKAEVFPDYVNEKYPALAAKMSCLQTAFFTSSYKLLPQHWFKKISDKQYEMSFTTDPNVEVGHLDVNADTGGFVYAISQLPPGKGYMAEGTTCTWPEYIKTWARVTGVSAKYVHIDREEMIATMPDKELGREIADMFDYCTDPGYLGGDTTLWTKEDIRKAGIECPMTSLEDWMKQEDWSAFFEA